MIGTFGILLAGGCEDSSQSRKTVPTGPPRLFADKFEAVKRCKTQAEVEEVMGCPPGIYTNVYPQWTQDEISKAFPSTASNYRDILEPLSWLGDDCMIIVDVSRKGREVYACYTLHRNDADR